MKTAKTRAPRVEVVPKAYASTCVHPAFTLYEVRLEGVWLESVSSCTGAERVAHRITRALRGFRKPAEKKR